MKKMITGALAVLLFSNAVHAQRGLKIKTQHPHQGKVQKLNLTKEQKVQFKALQQEQRAEIKALKRQKDLPPGEQQARRKAINKKYWQRWQALLTPAQKQDLATIDYLDYSKPGQKTDHLRDTIGRRGSFEEGRHTEKGAPIAKSLNLSREQQAKMKEIHAQYKTKGEEIRNDTSLSQEQKRARLQEAQQERQKQLKALLTPEQQEKMKTLRKSGSGRAQ